MDKANGAVLDLVTPVRFYKSMIPTIRHLWCGDADYATEATLWIHGLETPSVRSELNKGTDVWVYRNQSGETVGFGSLGLTEWRIAGQLVTVQYLPMLGVFTDHQGCPPEESGSPKYCYQIVDHLVDEAEERAEEYPLLWLSVHPENAKAIRVYTNSGFEWAEDVGGFSRMFLVLDRE